MIINSLFCPKRVFVLLWFAEQISITRSPQTLVFVMDTDCVFCWRRELKLYVRIELKSICRVLDDVHSQPHQSNTRYIY